MERRSGFIVNASPLILLARADSVPILHDLSREVVVPEAVWAEVLAGRHLHPGIDALSDLPWLSTLPNALVPVSVLAWELGAGESQVLAHGQVRSGYEVVVDDRQARRCAQSLGLRSVGTLGLVLRAKRAGLIPSARELVVRLLQEGMYLEPRLVKSALAEVGE